MGSWRNAEYAIRIGCRIQVQSNAQHLLQDGFGGMYMWNVVFGGPPVEPAGFNFLIDRDGKVLVNPRSSWALSSCWTIKSGPVVFPVREYWQPTFQFPKKWSAFRWFGIGLGFLGFLLSDIVQQAGYSAVKVRWVVPYRIGNDRKPIGVDFFSNLSNVHRQVSVDRAIKFGYCWVTGWLSNCFSTLRQSPHTIVA